MKRILLPTDFSDNADNAISYAVQLYKDVKCKFFLIHSYTPLVTNTGSMLDTYSPPAIQNIEKETAEQKLKETENFFKKKFKNENHSFISMASFNLLIPHMKEVIKEMKIDLVIMGTKGATGAKEIFIGTNTMKAIKKLNFPIIAVPAEFKYIKPTQVLLPTDYRFQKSNKYFSFIRELCEANNSRLHILYVYNSVPLEKKQQKMEAFLDVFFIDTLRLFHVAEKQDLVDAIETYEIKYKINLLIMLYNKHNFLENLLFKPVVNEMVYRTNVPFLVIPSKKQ